MRKKLVLICALTLLLATGIVTANAQEAHRDVAVTMGEITEIYGNKIKVTGQGSYEEIILNISDVTHILNGEEGTYLTKESLKTGQKVTVYYSSATTRSMPPQSNAFAILVGDDVLESAKYMKVGKVEKRDGIRILNSNQDQYVTFPEQSMPYLGKIKPGTELLTWFKISTMSYPGQAGSNQILLLNNKAKVKVHLQAGVIAINNKELKENYIKQDDKIMLPLESTAKALGYKVTKHPVRDAYILQKGDFTATVNMAEEYPAYVKIGTPIDLEQKPMVRNDITFVPVDYFTKVLGETVQLLDGHV